MLGPQAVFSRSDLAIVVVREHGGRDGSFHDVHVRFTVRDPLPARNLVAHAARAAAQSTEHPYCVYIDIHGSSALF